MGTGPSMLLFPCYAVTPIVPCYLLTEVYPLSLKLIIQIYVRKK